MNVLAIDGALGSFSVAILRDGSLAAARSAGGNVALESGLALVDSVLRETGTAPAQLGRLAVGAGPGGFTGLRIAIAYAKSLAQAWERPLVPISSFDSIEYGHAFSRVLAVVVGRPGVVSARYREGSEFRRESGLIADVLDALALSPSLEPLDVAGAPEGVLAALAERGMTVKPYPAPAIPAVAVALAALERDPARTPHEVRADYGELPAAKVPKR